VPFLIERSDVKVGCAGSCNTVFFITFMISKNLLIMNTTSPLNLQLVAKCGLYCGNCKRYVSGKCPGCEANVKASWCKARACCLENGYNTCADCATTNPRECKKFSNFVSSLFALVFQSDRPASIDYIKEHGREAYINLMLDQKRMVVRKGSSPEKRSN
jgi:hypothetical protein